MQLGYDTYFTSDIKTMHHLSGSMGQAVDEEKKYVAKIFPNELRFLREQKGLIYSKLYYTVKALHLLSLRNARARAKAYFYWREGVLGK